VHEPSEDKSDDSKDSFFFYALQQVFEHFSKFHLKILLDINATVGRENISNRQLGMGVYMRIVMIIMLE